MNDITRGLIRNILIFVALLIIAIVLLNFFAALPVPTGSVWIIPAWAPAGAVLLLIVSTYTYWSAGRALLRRRDQNLKRAMSMPVTARTTSPTSLPNAVRDVADHLEGLGFTVLGEADDIYLETLDRHPSWIYALRDGAILAWVMKHPLAQQATVIFASSFPDHFELRTVFPRTAVVNEPDHIIEFRTNLDEALRYHSDRLDQLSPAHGQPLTAPSLSEAIRLGDDARPRILPHLVNRVQDRWRKVVNWSTASGVIVAVLMTGAWVSGWFPLIVAALALSIGMIFYHLIQIVFVIQITRMNTPQPESS